VELNELPKIINRRLKG
jgi:hypothetical protein